LARVAVLIGIVSTAVAFTAEDASAHPFGDPESATISLTAEDTVRVHWQVGMVDDYTYLAQSLDLLPPERTLLDGVVDAQEGDPDLVQASAAFPRYVLGHIGVETGGERCRGSVRPIADLAADGVDIDFRCPGRVAEADITISMLTDLSTYYTTLATGPDGQREAYNGTQTSHAWSFDPDSAPAGSFDAGRSALLQTGAVIGLLIALGAAGVGVRRYRRRRAMAATSLTSPPAVLHPHQKAEL
jgi:hypothetical protein